MNKPDINKLELMEKVLQLMDVYKVTSLEAFEMKIVKLQHIATPITLPTEKPKMQIKDFEETLFFSSDDS